MSLSHYIHKIAISIICAQVWLSNRHIFLGNFSHKLLLFENNQYNLIENEWYIRKSLFVFYIIISGVPIKFVEGILGTILKISMKMCKNVGCLENKK